VSRHVGRRIGARQAGQGAGEGYRPGSTPYGPAGADYRGASLAKTGIGELQIIAGLGHQVVGGLGRAQLHLDRAGRQRSLMGIALATHGDPIVEALKGVRAATLQPGEVGLLDVRGAGHFPRQVLEDVPSLGRRVVYGGRLRRADNAVHKESHNPHHEQARDTQCHDHLHHGESHLGWSAAHAVSARGVGGVNRGAHGMDLTLVIVWLTCLPKRG
jgi:hypothetical protein